MTYEEFITQLRALNQTWRIEDTEDLKLIRNQYGECPICALNNALFPERHLRNTQVGQAANNLQLDENTRLNIIDCADSSSIDFDSDYVPARNNRVWNDIRGLVK